MTELDETRQELIKLLRTTNFIKKVKTEFS